MFKHGYGELGENFEEDILYLASAIVQSSVNKYVYTILNLMYKFVYKLNEENVYKSPWLTCV